MGANLEITEKLKNYINDFGLKLDPVQQEIIDHNNSLGDIKRMQIDPFQCYFLRCRKNSLPGSGRISQFQYQPNRQESNFLDTRCG